jgi:hypothetical protein
MTNRQIEAGLEKNEKNQMNLAVLMVFPLALTLHALYYMPRRGEPCRRTQGRLAGVGSRPE